jgi:hypothetical protein
MERRKSRGERWRERWSGRRRRVRSRRSRRSSRWWWRRKSRTAATSNTHDNLKCFGFKI